MLSCKEKINAQADQVFGYLSDFQNITDLYRDKVLITAVKDLGNTCYDKIYRYEVENNVDAKYKSRLSRFE